MFGELRIGLRFGRCEIHHRRDGILAKMPLDRKRQVPSEVVAELLKGREVVKQSLLCAVFAKRSDRIVLQVVDTRRRNWSIGEIHHSCFSRSYMLGDLFNSATCGLACSSAQS